MDPVTASMVVAGGSALFGGIMGQQGQASANRTNIRIAREANQFNAHQAMLNRSYQTNMSNTSHQREVADLERAGLNPILSATGGASTPSGSQATAMGATVQNEASAAISSAMEMKNMALQLRKQNAEVELLNEQSNKIKTEEKIIRKGLPEAEIKEGLWEKLKQAWGSSSKTLSDFNTKMEGFKNKNLMELHRKGLQYKKNNPETQYRYPRGGLR